MAEIKDKHPQWFKMKIERRQLIKEMPPEIAVKVLLACWDYLETETVPDYLNALEKVAFYAFFPDVEESWKKYSDRLKNGKKGGRPKRDED